MQKITIAGTIQKDGELRRRDGSDPVLNFGVSVSNGKDASGNWKDSTWYDCSIWGKRAEALQNSMTKGTKITLEGRPTFRAHDGKCYPGVSVNDFTFQGGGERQQTGNQDRQDHGAGAGGRPGVGGSSTDMDDEIPFAAEGRV
jgi:single-strand DNA-binding protein